MECDPTIHAAVQKHSKHKKSKAGKLWKKKGYQRHLALSVEKYCYYMYSMVI